MKFIKLINGIAVYFLSLPSRTEGWSIPLQTLNNTSVANSSAAPHPSFRALNVSNELPFQPFIVHGWTISGHYDDAFFYPFTEIDQATSQLLDLALTSFEGRRAELRIASGTRFQDFLSPWAHAQITVDFPRQAAGETTTYGQALSALEAFYDGLAERQTLEFHPLKARISRDGTEMIQISTSWDEGEILPIFPSAAQLSLQVCAHPARPLPTSDVRGLIQTTTRRYQNDYSIIEPRPYESQRGQVKLVLDFTQDDPGEVWPEMTLNEIAIILNGLAQIFQGRGAWCHLAGTLAFQPPYGDEIDVGIFYLEPPTRVANHRLSVADNNQTSVV